MTGSSFAQLFPELRDAQVSALPENLRAWLRHETETTVAAAVRPAVFAGVDPRCAALLWRAFCKAEALFGAAGLRVPLPEAFTAAGQDWPAFAAASGRDPAHAAPCERDPAPAAAGQDDPVPAAVGQDDPVSAAAQPETCQFDAVIAPHGLPAEAWHRIMPEGLSVSFARDILDNFDRLVDPPPHCPAVVTRDGYSRRVVWTVRWVSAAAAPDFPNTNWKRHEHPTVSELLTLQALRWGRAEAIDPHSFSWCAGRLGHGALAPRHGFDRSTNTVRISSRQIGQQAPHMGGRAVRSLSFFSDSRDN